MLKPSTPDQAWIARHIPHQGSMCLLDGVVAWDAQRIQCHTGTHRAFENPLRAFGRLGAACGIEYAAQAMAVHGALLEPADRNAARNAARGAARVGYLVSVRDTRLHVARLDDIDADLEVIANCLTRSENAVVYQFSVTAAGVPLLDGRATILINAHLNSPTPGETP
jgi:predicted hotdog family 3-hydroxylacyl-ACP dehydratase